VELLDLSTLVGFAGVPIVTALVQLIKMTWPEIESRWWPALSFLVAIGLNVGAAAALHSSLEVGFVWGILAGLSASGLYTWARVRTGPAAPAAPALPPIN